MFNAPKTRNEVDRPEDVIWHVTRCICGRGIKALAHERARPGNGGNNDDRFVYGIEPKLKEIPDATPVYKGYLCRKCRDSFLISRLAAYAIDVALVPVGSAVVAFFLLLTVFPYLPNPLELFLPASFGIERPETGAGFAILTFLLTITPYILLSVKDGFSGYSPGKFALGLKTIREKDGRGIGIGGSLKRNIPILAVLLFSALIKLYLNVKGAGAPASMYWAEKLSVLLVIFVGALIFTRMPGGYRPGDKIARTRVVPKKYMYVPPFVVPALIKETRDAKELEKQEVEELVASSY